MKLRLPWFTPVLTGLVWCLSPTTAQAQCADPVAQIVRIDRQVDYQAALTNVFVPVSLNLDVCLGDAVRTGERSRATIAFLESGVVLTIEQNTEWVVRQSPAPGRTLIDLLRGAILFFTRQPRSLEVQTPFVNAAVEGTEFLVRVEEDRAFVTVFEGQVAATNPIGSLTLTSNQSAVAVQGQAPQLQITVRPRDSVQWALYYQPILAGDSFGELEQIPEAQRDARFYVRRAGLLLGVGRLDEARSDIKQALSLNPNDGDAYGLLAVIAVALNNRAEALTNGREAVRRSPRSAAARMALSYALQANFELEAARDELLQAVADQPDDARAWARLAELWLSVGYLDRALEAAERAASLLPDVARTNTVLGFAALAQVDTSGARTAFERAISLESDSPLARLGLGLAKIRQGQLGEGRRDIEIAAALNPDDAIIRSYLGKAYFEEKRDPLSADQFEQAKNLDPLDPTPHYYDAIRRQTLNDPVGALRDLQQSIALNDNRAVYRSRLLLDQDFAARGARLGRIHRDLGFEQLALLEGWKSLAADPSAHSAHRLLADNYLVLPRHRIARDSELLVSQLLQPANISPVQPRLADNRLAFLDDTGVSDVGFNEFTRLFASNQVSFVADVIGGNNKTFTDNVIHSGIYNKVSYSVGQFRLDTDGIRKNNNFTQNIYNAFVQTDLTPKAMIQAEFRGTDNEGGDPVLLFFPGNFSSSQRNKADTKSVRLGFRQRFAPNSTLIGSYVHRRLDSDLDAGFFRSVTDDTADVVELRHLYQRDWLNLTGGFGYYDSDVVGTRTLRGRQFPPSQRKVTHKNGYMYAHINRPRDVTVVLGVSADLFDDALTPRDEVNPKIGVMWSATPNTLVRVGGFTSLKRTLISSQTLEPTQVAGFNQFFDDVNVTDSRGVGVAVHQTINPQMFAGAEFSHRDLKVPTRSQATGEAVDIDREENLGGAYFYATPTQSVALSVEYKFERLVRDPLGRNEGVLAKSTAHKLPAEVRFFDPSGVFGRARATYAHQEGLFQDASFRIVPGHDEFWIVDASVGYRLPNQLGLLVIEVRNLFDQHFQFQDTDPFNDTVARERLFLARLTVAF
jgi:tetratricopeptide (TPR) repeat protein